MNEVQRIIVDILNYRLFTIKNVSFHVETVLYILVLMILVVWISGKFKNWLVKRIFPRFEIEYGVSIAIAQMLRYLVVTIGFLIIVQSSGIDLSSFVVLAGALGIGVGLGLQNAITEFVAGIIIMFERPVKVGDRIVVDGIEGNVMKIAPRATVIQTNDNVSIIVPNSKFISSNVTNWTYSDKKVRIHNPVGVSYGSDPVEIDRLLMEVAEAHNGVLKDPAPKVVFKEFGTSSINFDLMVWTEEYMSRPAILRSELNFAIWQKLKENGVEIPFQQLDVRLVGNEIAKN